MRVYLRTGPEVSDEVVGSWRARTGMSGMSLYPVRVLPVRVLPVRVLDVGVRNQGRVVFGVEVAEEKRGSSRLIALTSPKGPCDCPIRSCALGIYGGRCETYLSTRLSPPSRPLFPRPSLQFIPIRRSSLTSTNPSHFISSASGTSQ
jgi:hypothetical protein